MMPPCPSELNVALSSDVDHVFALALAKQARTRFPSASQFAETLGQAMQDNLAPKWREAATKQLQRNPWGQRAKDIAVTLPT